MKDKAWGKFVIYLQTRKSYRPLQHPFSKPFCCVYLYFLLRTSINSFFQLNIAQILTKNPTEIKCETMFFLLVVHGFFSLLPNHHGFIILANLLYSNNLKSLPSYSTRKGCRSVIGQWIMKKNKRTTLSSLQSSMVIYNFSASWSFLRAAFTRSSCRRISSSETITDCMRGWSAVI